MSGKRRVRMAAAPPRPGLKARVEQRSVLVTYDVGRPPARCRPVSVAVLVVDSANPISPLGRRQRLRGVRRGTVTIDIPDGLQIRPDIARVTTTTARGLSSPVAEIRLDPH